MFIVIGEEFRRERNGATIMEKVKLKSLKNLVKNRMRLKDLVNSAKRI